MADNPKGNHAMGPLRALAGAFALVALLGSTNLAVADRSNVRLRHVQSDQQLFSDVQLASFAAAVINVMGIRQEYMQRMAITQDDRERQALQQEGSTKMVAAIEDEGLTVDSYNSIIDAARSDPTLRFRIDAMISELAEQRG